MATHAPLSVIAAFYDETSKAQDTLKVLQRLRDRGAIEVVDAAIMSWPKESECLQITESADLGGPDPAAAGAIAGSILGVLFPPSILALGAVGAGAGAALAHFSEQGFDNNLLKEIGENLPPGGAAVVAVVEEKWLADLSETLSEYSAMERFAMRPDVTARSD